MGSPALQTITHVLASAMRSAASSHPRRRTPVRLLVLLLTRRASSLVRPRSTVTISPAMVRPARSVSCLSATPVRYFRPATSIVRLLTAYVRIGIKLSYVMSLYYESQNRNAMACSFAGNGTVNAAATASATAVASSCIASPSAVFTPSAVSTPAQVSQPPSTGSDAGGSSGSGSGSTKSGAEAQAVFGVGMMVVVSLMSAAWTFA